MKISTIMATLLLAVSGALAGAQSLDELLIIGNKARCSVDDLALMLPSVGQVLPESSGFDERVHKALERYQGDDVLTKGRAAYVAARALRLRGSLMYFILPTERYALRAFMGEGIFTGTASGADVMTGTELLEFIASLATKYGEAQ